MHLNITTIYEANDPCLKDYHNIREKDLVGRKQQFIAEGKVILSALLHSKKFSPLSVLIVTERLPRLMPLLERNTLIYNDNSLFCMLNESPNIVRFSHFKSVYVESIKTIPLHVKSGAGVWVKFIQERTKNGSYEPS
ncbi:hypothetical protein ABID39_000341 [Bartonella japonica]|uniref:Uncharacterized protein n=1 Tax=Bartonella japonica TaxID=357761 RepID=A0ABV2FM57_9HYPH